MANVKPKDSKQKKIPEIVVTQHGQGREEGSKPVKSILQSLKSKKGQKSVTFDPVYDFPDDDASAEVTANAKASKFRDEWKEYTERVKVHEMVKCLEAEYKKLQILRDRTDWDELQKQQEINALHLRTTEGDKSTKKKKRSIMLMKSLQEEKEYLLAIYPSIKQAFGDPKYISQSAARIFKTRDNITEEEVESVMDLCNDKIEQRALRDALEEKRSREKYLQNASERRRMMYDFINSKFFTDFMLYIIMISVIGISLLTFERISSRYVYPLIIMDCCIIGIFVVEAILKISIYREDYFKKPWNILDMIIICTHIGDVLVDLITKTLALSSDINAHIAFKFLKSLRALRLLRVIKFMPSLQVILTTVFESFLSLGSIAVLMLLFIFVFAVMGKGLFSEDAPEQFGQIFVAFVTLFQLLTLDDWFEILLAVSDKGTQYWLLFAYLFTYLVLEYFVFLNLFVAVLVDNFQLSLAEAEYKRQKETLDFGDATNKLNIMANEIDSKTNLVVEENPNRQYELDVENYFPLIPGTTEYQLLKDLMKNLTTIDFESFIWNRRMSMLNNLMDGGLISQVYSSKAELEELEDYLKPEVDKMVRKRKPTFATIPDTA